MSLITFSVTLNVPSRNSASVEAEMPTQFVVMARSTFSSVHRRLCVLLEAVVDPLASMFATNVASVAEGRATAWSAMAAVPFVLDGFAGAALPRAMP